MGGSGMGLERQAVSSNQAAVPASTCRRGDKYDMKVSIETLEGLQRKLTVSVPAEQFDAAYQQRLNALARTVKLDGFRKGKVPLKVIRQKFGSRVEREALAGLIQSSYEQAVRREKLNPAGPPHIDSRPPGAGQDVHYTAVLEVQPEFELGDMSKLKISRPVVVITDQDVENTLLKLRKQRAKWEPAERPAASGDQVTVDYEGTLSGEPFEGGQGVDVTVVLGEDRMPADFESQLEGMVAGEQRSIKTTFPEDFDKEWLRGKEAVFEVTCKRVLAPELPGLDAAFAREFGVEDGSVDTLRDNVRHQLESELAKGIRAYLKERVLSGLIGLHKIELPKVMIEAEVRRLQQETLQRWGLKEADLERLPRESFEARARHQVQLKLVAARLIREKGIQADPETVHKIIRQAVADYEQPDEMFNFYLNNPKALEHFRSLAVEERMVDEVLKAADVVDKEMGFDELIRQVRT